MPTLAPQPAAAAEAQVRPAAAMNANGKQRESKERVPPTLPPADAAAMAEQGTNPEAEEVLLGATLANVPGSLVEDPRHAGINLRGMVFDGRVAGRLPQGRYALEVKGVLTADGREHDLHLVDARGLTAALVRRVMAMSEDEASEYHQ